METLTSLPVWTLGDRLRKARDHAGLSVQEMADDLGVSRTTISKYEHDATGKRGVPRMAILRYADVSGIPIEWIETGTTDSDEGGSTLSTWTPSTPGQGSFPFLLVA
jgi:transcriptional regulator with XRE-family HTH domain